MSVLHVARNALEDFWERYDLPVHWEKDAVYEVTTDFGFLVHIFVEEESGLIRVWTTLSPKASDTQRKAVHAALLEVNLVDHLVFGGSLALHPETLEIIYQRTYDPLQGGWGGFSRFFIAFTEAASGLQAAVTTSIPGKEDLPILSGMRA
ncbi:MAG: hypothetical protein LBI62_08165 [Candidatus Accumulibacter sp.]|jgi:hypothetical protein|nr:hypothetical protein [Accumulibacter sp.]